MDRSDIAGLNAHTPIGIHFGELDQPGPENHSASYNHSVGQTLQELRAINAVVASNTPPRLLLTPGKGHEMDNEKLLHFIAEHDGTALNPIV